MTKLELYEKIRYNAEFEETWPDEWSEMLSPLCSQEELLNDLETVYQQMIQYDRDNQDREKRKTLSKYLFREYEVKFSVIAMALGLKGDTSLIPKMFQYVALDDLMKSPVILVGFVQEEINRCICNPEYYGESYIPVLLAHIHQLVPDKMLWAGSFFYDTLYYDLNTFEDHPLMRHLHLARREPFLELMDYCLKQTLETFEEDHPDQVEDILRLINSPIKSITSETEGIVQIAYIKQQFLKLHAAD